jgi:hypothetical protein
MATQSDSAPGIVFETAVAVFANLLKIPSEWLGDFRSLTVRP